MTPVRLLACLCAGQLVLVCWATGDWVWAAGLLGAPRAVGG